MPASRNSIAIGNSICLDGKTHVIEREMYGNTYGCRVSLLS